MAIPAGCVWEVRTTGNSANGGGFNSARGGTDYSQQDSAQLSLTDLACASNTTLTSATGGFTAAMVGNVIYIASGTNAAAGYYEITAYTDTNTVTIDRTCATGGNMTDGVGKVGGATSHPANIQAAVIGGNAVWIKAGTYTLRGGDTHFLSITVAGTADSAYGLGWLGYNTTRDDKPTGTNRPLFDCTGATNGINLAAHGNSFEHLRISGATGSGVAGNFANRCVNVLVQNCGGYAFANRGLRIGCQASTSGGGFQGGTNISCYANDNSGNYSFQGGQNIGCIADSNAASNYGSFTSHYSSHFTINCLAYNASGGLSSGFHVLPDTNQQGIESVVLNNISVSNVRGFSNNNHNNCKSVFVAYTSTYDNSIENYQGDRFTDRGYWIETDPKLNAPATGDFTLQSGSPLIGAGLDVSTFTSLTTDFNVNIGVDQTNPDGGGGGTTVSNWFAGE